VAAEQNKSWSALSRSRSRSHAVDRDQVESSLGEGAQMFALEIHPPGDRLRSSGNDPQFIFLRSFEQEIVEFFPTAGFGTGTRWFRRN
jgi:hypothetical protein